MATTLENFLQELRGESPASGGGFTLDVGAQARKLGAHGGVTPTLLALQAVQAGVASGATEVVVKILREGLEVSFRLGQDLRFSPKEGPKGRAQTHLFHALQSAFWIGAHQVQLSVDGRSWTWQEGRLVNEVGCSLTCELRIVWEKESWWKRILPSARTAHIQGDLAARLRFCPVPVKVDGRLMNSPCPESLSEAKVKPAHPGYYWLAEHLELSSSAHAFCLVSLGSRGVVRVKLGPDGQAAGLPLKEYHTLSFRNPPVSVVGWVEGALSQDHWEMRQKCEVIEPTSMQGTKIIDVFATGNWNSDLPLSFRLARYCVHKAAIPYFGVGLCLPRMGACLAPNLQIPLPAPNHRYKSPGTLPCMRLSSWLGLRALPAGQPSLLYYLQDGVLLNPIEVASAYPGSVCLLAREDVEVDLSYLNPVRNERVKADLRQMRELETKLSREGRAQIEGKDAAELEIPGAMRKAWAKLY